MVSSFLILATCAWSQNSPTTIQVDVQANRHAISPLIYGVNLFEDANTTTILQDLNCPINRYGGNRASTYNWNANSDNRGNDYFFESISDDNFQPAGLRGDNFVTQNKNAGADSMLTLPMLDWMAKPGITQPFPCSYGRARFPDQQQFEEFDPDCGNGIGLDGKRLDGAVPSDAYVAHSLNDAQAWMQHTTGNFGT